MGNVMRVDEVAAHNLLLALGLDSAGPVLADVAEHMRGHRVAAERFQLDQARDALFTHLETAFMRLRADDDGWSAGYGAAENEALNWFAMRCHAVETPPASSKGKILRTMIRDRKGGAPGGRNSP